MLLRLKIPTPLKSANLFFLSEITRNLRNEFKEKKMRSNRQEKIEDVSLNSFSSGSLASIEWGKEKHFSMCFFFRLRVRTCEKGG